MNADKHGSDSSWRVEMLGLSINREKTKGVNLGEGGGEGLDFLGFTFR